MHAKQQLPSVLPWPLQQDLVCSRQARQQPRVVHVFAAKDDECPQRPAVITLGVARSGLLLSEGGEIEFGLGGARSSNYLLDRNPTFSTHCLIRLSISWD